MPPDLAAHYELAYEEGKGALAAQQTAVDELRSRVSVLVAAAAIATSLLGGQALAGGEVGPMSWLAIACLVLLGVTVLIVLWPRRDWVFSIDAGRLITTYVEHPDGPLDLPMIHRDLALHLSESHEANAGQVRRLALAFRVGSALLLAEVVAWIAGILDRAYT